MRAYVAAIWGWDDADQFARFQCQFLADPRRYQVIVVAGDDVGAVALEWRPGEAFLADLEIALAWRGRGLGTAIIRTILAEAEKRGVPVTLQVLQGNPARLLYERLGFRVVSQTATHCHMRAVCPVDDPCSR